MERSGSRGRHGVSEVVATLMMLAIVVGLGVVVFTFASGSLGSATQGFSNLMASQGTAVDESFVVEQAAFTTSGSPQGATIYVRDVGSSPVTVVSVYIVSQTNGAFVGQFPISSTTINVGAFASIGPSTLHFTPTLGYTYSFTVTSSLGNSVIYYAKAN
jgi:hypothetical protein